MNESGISLLRYPYDDDSWHLQLSGSDAGFGGTQEFYAHPDELVAFATKLTEFPRSIRDEARFERGAPPGRYADYVLLRAYLYDSVGHAALEFAVHSTVGLPAGGRAHFHIGCDVAALNRLGEQLHHWIHATDEPLIWNARNA